MHADGREIPVELTITRIDVPGPPMYTGYVRDITDRLERERELRRARARGSSPPPTRPAGGWSATSTTAPRTGCSRSGWS